MTQVMPTNHLTTSGASDILPEQGYDGFLLWDRYELNGVIILIENLEKTPAKLNSPLGPFSKIKEETMKKILLLLSISLVLPTLSLAADSVKIGCIDLQRVVYESEAGKKAKADIDALVTSKKSVLDGKRKPIEKLRSELEKQGSVLSPEAKKSKQEELEKLEREYLRTAQDSDAEVRKKDTELRDMILKEILELVGKIGKEEGYTLIIERGSVLYLDKGIDITDMIIKKYNESKTKPKKQ